LPFSSVSRPSTDAVLEGVGVAFSGKSSVEMASSE
jgi:hypothetical protein